MGPKPPKTHPTSKTGPDGLEVRECGNGIVEAEEACDDGNAVDTDDCTSACRLAVCGDGIVWEGHEECEGDAPRPCLTACDTTGSESCTACVWEGWCAPPGEGCNGVDADCDTTADEDFECVLGRDRVCVTGCGSSGTQTCLDGCSWGVCQVPAESCNLRDDDCDGATDEGCLSEGLLGYWPFDGTGEDATQGNRDLTVMGGAGFAVGLFGEALDLEGTVSEYAVRPTNDLVFDFGAGDFTVQVWVRYRSLAGEQVLVEEFSGASGPGWTLTRVPDLRLHLYASSAAVLYSPVLALDTEHWHQMVARRAGGRFDLLFDGALVATVTGAAPITSSTNPLLVGRRNADDGRGFATNGRLDELAIWGRALSDAEVAALWNGGIGRPVVSSP